MSLGRSLPSALPPVLFLPQQTGLTEIKGVRVTQNLPLLADTNKGAKTQLQAEALH